MADTVRNEGLLTRAVDTDGASADLGRAPAAERLVQRILLIAEAAADVRFDYVNVCPRTADGLSADTSDYMGDLGGCGAHDAAVLFVSKAAVILNVAMLNGGRVVPALDLDQAGLFDRLFVIACMIEGVL